MVHELHAILKVITSHSLFCFHFVIRSYQLTLQQDQVGLHKGMGANHFYVIKKKKALNASGEAF